MLIDWSPFVITGNTMPPRDPNDDDDDDEDEDNDTEPQNCAYDPYRASAVHQWSCDM